MKSRFYFGVYVKSLAVGLNNIIVFDWTLLRSSHLGLTVAERNLLLDGSSEPFVECNYSAYVYDQGSVPLGASR